MLIMLISSSTKASETSKSYTHLPAGESTKEEVWCYNASNLKILRNGLETCEAERIELKHLRILNEELKKTETSHQPVWRKWWVKFPLGIAIGALSGYLAGEHDASPALAGVAGGVAAATTVALLDIDF